MRTIITPEILLERNGLSGAMRRPLAGDASARRYERLERADGPPLILVSTPNPEEDLRPFVAIGAALEGLGLSVPHVYDQDAEAGLAILEDFGDETFSRLLDAGADAEQLYALATDVLVAVHDRFAPDQARALALPRYEPALFLDQVMLFADVYPSAALGRPVGQRHRNDLEAAWRSVIASACDGPFSLLLRDYHVDNLMRLPRPGLRAAGLLDFQGAGFGPVAYDLMSLLEDARRDVPDDRADRMVARYLAARPAVDADAFRRSYAVLAAVRHARVVAIFVRLALARKRAYLAHLPRVWRLLERRLGDPALAPVAAWFDQHLPPRLRADFVVPEPK